MPSSSSGTTPSRLSQQYEKNLAVVESDMGDTLLIFDQRSDNVHALNITGKILWHAFDANADLAALIRVIEKWFTRGVDRARATDDATRFLADLQRAGLLMSPGTGGGFPVGKEVSFRQNLPDVPYVEPRVNTFTKQWLKQQHPDAFNRVMFADTWGPSVNGALGMGHQ